MENITYDRLNNQLYILDQTLLPNEEKEILLDTKEAMFDAIKLLKVRGAPAIGICAGYCIAVLANQYVKENIDVHKLLEKLQEDGKYLNSSRPTAVNLSWALTRMINKAKVLAVKESDSNKVAQELTCEAILIHKEDIDMCTAIAKHGLSLIKDGDTILTHCNAGPLATSKYGTALGPILLGTEQGNTFHVYADETRPLLQGARLTTYELYKAGVDVTLICDNMANTVMKKGRIDAVFVGSDRICANGDAANKIGTCNVAILAKYYNVPFYVLAPSSTIDMDCKSGDDIIIEEREPGEIKNMFYEKPMALEGVKCFNPSFDVTDHSLITAIVTEKGVIYPPFDEGLRNI